MNAIPAAAGNVLATFSAPREAFSFAKQRPGLWWAPVALLLLASTAFWTYYFSTVDTAWLVDFELSQMAAKMPPEITSQARAMMTPRIMLIEAVFIVLVSIGIKLSAVAAYLQLTAKLSGDTKTRFGQWLSLVAWSMLPMLVGLAGQTLNVLWSSTGHIDPESLSVTTLASITGFSAPKGWLQLVFNYDFMQLWSLALLVIGVSVYQAVPMRRAALLVLSPWLLLLLARALASGLA
jgi:hypothetical protein